MFAQCTVSCTNQAFYFDLTKASSLLLLINDIYLYPEAVEHILLQLILQ